MAPAMRLPLLLFFLIATANVFGVGARRLLAAQIHTYDWRTSQGLEITVNYGDTVKFKWSQGPKTSVVQLAPPGLCVGGKPFKTAQWQGLQMRGNRTPSTKGTVKVKFVTGGSFFFTSPVAGDCDARWLRVWVKAPAYSGPYSG